MLRIQITSSDDGISMAVRGDLDTEGSGELRVCVSEALRTYRPGHIDLELSGVDFIDCSGCRTLLWVQQRARGRGGTVTVVRPSSLVLRLLRILEFDQELTIRNTPEDTTPMSMEANPGLN
jgi:anti-sigma B factor antagonist